MDEIKKVAKEFIAQNGNKTFTTKELLIYFNNERKNEIGKLFTKLDELPCSGNEDRLGNLETTLKIIKTVLVVAIPSTLALIGLVIGNVI